MNAVGSGFASALLVDNIITELRSLVSDSDVAVSVSVNTATSRTVDPASGDVTDVTDADAVTGYLSPLTAREVSDGDYQSGDHRLLVDASLLSSTPTTASTVTIDGASWRVVGVEQDSLGAVYHLIVRQSK